MDSALLAFLGVSAAVIVTPGPDTALTIRSARGRPTGRRVHGHGIRAGGRRAFAGLLLLCGAMSRCRH